MSKQAQQTVTIVELERAINYWRAQHPSSRDTMTLCPQAACLAELYAQMIINRAHEISLAEFPDKAEKSFRLACQEQEMTQELPQPAHQQAGRLPQLG
jgi:hypothetical protein